jgi:hypothetical protein
MQYYVKDNLHTPERRNLIRIPAALSINLASIGFIHFINSVGSLKLIHNNNNRSNKKKFIHKNSNYYHQCYETQLDLYSI